MLALRWKPVLVQCWMVSRAAWPSGLKKALSFRIIELAL